MSYPISQASEKKLSEHAETGHSMKCQEQSRVERVGTSSQNACNQPNQQNVRVRNEHSASKKVFTTVVKHTM